MAALVFVVDDARLIAMTVAAILSRAGYEVVEFHDSREALKAALERRPDVIISDVIMPGLTGVELCIQVRAAYPKCRVMLFSAHTQTSELLEQALRDGHKFEVYAKPVHPTVLLNALARDW